MSTWRLRVVRSRSSMLHSRIRYSFTLLQYTVPVDDIMKKPRSIGGGTYVVCSAKRNNPLSGVWWSLENFSWVIGCTQHRAPLLVTSRPIIYIYILAAAAPCPSSSKGITFIHFSGVRSRGDEGNTSSSVFCLLSSGYVSLSSVSLRKIDGWSGTYYYSLYQCVVVASTCKIKSDDSDKTYDNH